MLECFDFVKHHSYICLLWFDPNKHGKIRSFLNQIQDFMSYMNYYPYIKFERLSNHPTEFIDNKIVELLDNILWREVSYKRN